MKKSTPKFRYYNGDKAILASYIGYYEFRVKLDMISSMEENLEIIVDRDSEIVARRYDWPKSLNHFVEHNGEWELTEKGELYSADQKRELFDFIANIPKMAMEKLKDFCGN